MSIILPQTIKIKWTTRTRKHYKELGYNYTKLYDEFNVNVLDLPSNSRAEVKCNCDYCGNECTSTFLIANPNNINKYKLKSKIACNNCKSKKSKECIQEIYGVENYSQTKEFKEKCKQTNLERYGTEHYSQTNECKEKMKQKCLKKYGVDSYFKSEEIKNKIKETNLEKYGVENVFQAEEIKNKIKQTWINNYGVDNPWKSEEVKEKITKTMIEKYGCKNIMQNQEIREQAIEKMLVTMYKNNNTNCSKPQEHIYNLIGGELEFPVNRCSLDIAFINEKIDIEYDGGGHYLGVKLGQITIEQAKQNDIKRDKFLKSQGWKIIRITNFNDIIFNDKLIKELIDEAKNYLINSNHTWVNINFDERKFICSEYKKNI